MIITKLRFYVVCCIAASSLNCAAEAALFISYQSLPDRIRHQNPDLKAARYRINEAAGKMKQAGRLSNPDLRIESSHDIQFKNVL